MLGAIYARYSAGPNQTDQSIEGQVADCQAYAERNGIQIVEIYADRHISGKSIVGRNEFQRMLHDAEQHRFECVIVWKIDRFGRDRQDIALSKMKLKKAGVRLLYAEESVPEGPEGIILESVLEGLAEYYSADLRQKIVRGMRETAKKGQYCGAPLPIGYTVDDEKHIIVDEEKAAVVREAFWMHNAGAQTKELVELFRKHGVTGQRGKPITQAVIYRMLRNEKYLGRFEIQGVEILTDPIIDLATFEEAAKHFGTPRNNAAGRAKVDYLLSCKCFCSYCGAMLNGESGTSKTGKVYHYYKCGAKKRGEKCELKPIPRDHFEDRVIEATVEDMLTEDMIEKLTVRILEIQEQEDALDPAAAYRKQLDSNRKRQRNILDAIEEGTGARGLAGRLAELEAEEEELLVEIERAEMKKPRLTSEAVGAWLRSFRNGDTKDAAFRQRLVDTFIARIEVRNGQAMIFYNIQEKGPHSKVRVRPEWWRWRELNPRPKALRRDFLRAQTIIAEVLLLLFPSLTADRHAVRSGELHDVWHGQSLPYAHLPLNDALPGSRSFRVGRLPLIRQQQQQCCCYLIYNLPVLWRSGAAARWSRLHTPVETLTPPRRRKVRSAPSPPSAFGCRRGLRSLPCSSSHTKICGSLRVLGDEGDAASLRSRSCIGDLLWVCAGLVPMEDGLFIPSLIFPCFPLLGPCRRS